MVNPGFGWPEPFCKCKYRTFFSIGSNIAGFFYNKHHFCTLL